MLRGTVGRQVQSPVNVPFGKGSKSLLSFRYQRGSSFANCLWPLPELTS